MRSQNIKYNSFGKVGGGSCLLLLLLAFLAVNPMASSTVLAQGSSEGADASGYGNNGSGGGGTTQVISTVNIAFSPTAGEASMTPATTAGASARTMVLATVGVQNSGGYSVYLKSNDQNLVGKKMGETIGPITGSVTYSNLATNTWGYAAAEGTTVPDSANYQAVSTSGNGTLIGSNTSSDIASDSKTFALSFAAKIGSDKPADTYQNQMTVSVVSAPGQVALFGGIQTMQAMTPSICSAAGVGDEAQLRDTRDGKMYWVAKLADNKCWMTQNLDLDLSTSKYLSPSDSDVSSNWTPGYSTADTATDSTTLADNAGQRSWSLGDYRITNPTTSRDCGFPRNSAADCPSQFTAYTTPTSANGDVNAHYILGNHYQWNAATAGTGGSITSGQATSSICPKGWKLPESNVTTAGSFGGLINAGSIGTDVAKLTSSPYYFVRGGDVNQNARDLFEGAGDYGNYWSSTPNSSSSNAYYLTFYYANSIGPSSYSNYSRRYGLSVRCIVR